MAFVYISEYIQAAAAPLGMQIADETQPSLDQAPLAVSSTAAVSQPFQATTRMISISTDTICSIVFSYYNGKSATTANKRLPANAFIYFKVVGGMTVSVIANS